MRRSPKSPKEPFSWTPAWVWFRYVDTLLTSLVTCNPQCRRDVLFGAVEVQGAVRSLVVIKTFVRKKQMWHDKHSFTIDLKAMAELCRRGSFPWKLSTAVLLTLSGETRWMLRPHFPALSISLAINATCKLLKGSQDSPGALSSVISINGKNQILLSWQPAGMNHTFIGDGGMSGFPERPNSSRVETETAISRKCQRRGVCIGYLKAFGIFGGLSSVCVVPCVRFSNTDLHRSHSSQNSLWRKTFIFIWKSMTECNCAKCRSKYPLTHKLKMLVRICRLLFSMRGYFSSLHCSVNKTVHTRNN